MQPDIRPTSILTSAIINTCQAWVLIDGGRAAIAKANDVHFQDWQCASDGESLPTLAIGVLQQNRMEFLCETTTCYPCEPLPPFKPVPWPMLPGEEEIEEWTQFIQQHPGGTVLGRSHNVDDSISWYLVAIDRYGELTEDSDISVDAAPLHDNYHPAPRQGNRWVWEADR